MWILNSFASVFHAKSPPRHPESNRGLGWSVSFVRARSSDGDYGEAGHIDKKAWKQAQLDAGRIVISDAHFEIGQHIKSVPRLKDLTLEEARQRRLGNHQEYLRMNEKLMKSS